MKRLLLLALLTTSVDAEVSDNLIDPNAWELEGDVMIEEAGTWQGQEHDVIRFGTDGGTATQDLDFSAYEQLNTIKYGMEAIGCNNTGRSWCDVGTAYDELVITLKFGDEEFVYTVELDYNDGFVAFDNVVDPVATYADSGWIRIYGRDVGMWSGWYGPIMHSHFLEVNYTIPTYDPVKDDPDFLKRITGETQVIDIATKPENLTEEMKLQEPIKVEQVVKVEMNEIKPQQQQEIKNQEIKVDVKPEQKAEQQQRTKEQTNNDRSRIRLSSVMQNVTINGVPASETQEANSYNDIAQAVALSLLMAKDLEDTKLPDAPFYKQEQMPDAKLNQVYTGYNAINNSKMNKLMDMQWRK